MPVRLYSTLLPLAGQKPANNQLNAMESDRNFDQLNTETDL